MRTDVQRRMFTADEYHRMAETGILGYDDRVELVDGAIVEMTPIGPRHMACVDRLNLLLQRRFAGEAIVRVQGPVRLDPYSEPQPDLALLEHRADFYATAHPGPANVLLVIEVADSSVPFDRAVKLPLYARSGVAEVWLVDLVHDRIDVFTRPSPDGYRASAAASRGEAIPSDLLSPSRVLADDVLGTR